VTFQLAKQLKRAGFTKPTGFPIMLGPLPEAEQSWPTLSELIEACGDKFNNLYKSPSGWEAKGRQEKYDDPISDQMICGGQTPEEAVARLWLALNSPKPV
jgi:hypothetical protein